MRSPIALALDNLEAVLTAADMTLANVVRLGVYSTHVDESLFRVVRELRDHQNRARG